MYMYITVKDSRQLSIEIKKNSYLPITQYTLHTFAQSLSVIVHELSINSTSNESIIQQYNSYTGTSLSTHNH